MTTTKQKKNSKLRYLEYYDLQDTLDMLYADSGRRKIFNNLMPLIESEENICCYAGTDQNNRQVEVKKLYWSSKQG